MAFFSFLFRRFYAEFHFFFLHLIQAANIDNVQTLKQSIGSVCIGAALLKSLAVIS